MVRNNKILITGASGFIGSHLVKYFLQYTDFKIIALVRNNYAGNLNRLSSIPAEYQGRLKIFWKDLKDEFTIFDCHEIGQVAFIYHLAASSHVDRSISNPKAFVLDNVLGTLNLLEHYRIFNHEAKFLYFSTDEVFGPAPVNIEYKEWDRYNSSNPYAATKAGAEELCLAYANTYGLHISITHTMNVFGELQHPEKYIPLCINKIKNEKTIKVHSSKNGIPGTRFYIYAGRVAEAIHFLMTTMQKGEKYNIVGDREIDNLNLAERISDIINMDLKFELVDFHSSRPGHDLRYALDGSKLKKMGFKYSSSFEEDLERTVKSYG